MEEVVVSSAPSLLSEGSGPEGSDGVVPLWFSGGCRRPDRRDAGGCRGVQQNPGGAGPGGNRAVQPRGPGTRQNPRVLLSDTEEHLDQPGEDLK